MSSTDVKAWERVSFTSRQRFHAFAHFRDLPPADRSIRAAYNQHRTQCQNKSGERGASGRWELWSREDQWAERLQAWDIEIDRRKREAFVGEQIRATERHARMLAAAQQVLTIPLRAVLELANTPDAYANLKTTLNGGAGFLRALTEARHSIALMPSIVASERLILGLSTEATEVRDGPHIDTIAERIVRSEAATAAAVELVHQLAHIDPPQGD